MKEFAEEKILIYLAIKTNKRMALRDKYSELITAAYATGVINLQIHEQKGTLYISGLAPSERVRQKLLELHDKLNTDHQSGNVMVDIKVEKVRE